MDIDLKYMERALFIARKGEGFVSPNPMVGAVIVGSAGEIVGEGFHRSYGGPHAEVNAIAEVKDESLLADCTLYVTLEPCSHYGKTPPCASLIVEKHIPRVVVGCLDPFEKVSGRGVKMLRDAGVEVEVLDGEINRKCREINKRFITAHTAHRPYVTLKWAQSSDGYIDRRRTPESPSAFRFSTPLSQALVHRLRAVNDAILVGSGTILNDNPRLNVRKWDGRDPLRVAVDRHGVIPQDSAIFADDNYLIVNDAEDIPSLLKILYGHGVTSLLVEGGAKILTSFIESGLWDEARVEVSPVEFGADGGVAAPELPSIPTDRKGIIRACHIRNVNAEVVC